MASAEARMRTRIPNGRPPAYKAMLGPSHKGGGWAKIAAEIMHCGFWLCPLSIHDCLTKCGLSVI